MSSLHAEDQLYQHHRDDPDVFLGRSGVRHIPHQMVVGQGAQGSLSSSYRRRLRETGEGTDLDIIHVVAGIVVVGDVEVVHVIVVVAETSLISISIS